MNERFRLSGRPQEAGRNAGADLAVPRAGAASPTGKVRGV